MVAVSVFVLLLVSMMLVYVNTIFYAVVVVLVSVLSLYLLVSAGAISLLTYLFVVIVYVGAVIIFVGYVCAVCPNFVITNNSVLLKYLVFFYILVSCLLISLSLDLSPIVVSGDVMFNYFYSSWGGSVLVSLMFILFLVLLIVTSQFSQPKGPFRSS